MSYDPAKLFRAVVVSGAALGCGSRTATPAPEAEKVIADVSPAGDAAPSSDAAAPSNDAAVTTADAGPRPCPKGSEMPFPPCYFIR